MRATRNTFILSNENLTLDVPLSILGSCQRILMLDDRTTCNIVCISPDTAGYIKRILECAQPIWKLPSFGDHSTLEGQLILAFSLTTSASQKPRMFQNKFSN